VGRFPHTWFLRRSAPTELTGKPWERERQHRLIDDDDSNDGDFDGGKPQYWSLIYHFTPAIKRGENYRPAKGRKNDTRRQDVAPTLIAGLNSLNCYNAVAW